MKHRRVLEDEADTMLAWYGEAYADTLPAELAAMQTFNVNTDTEADTWDGAE